MADDYDIGAAFAAIEDELIASMMRNMERHKVEEIAENKQWSMWQAEQLKALEKYKRDNLKKYKKQFKMINKQIDTVIRQMKQSGSMEQEIRILQAIKKGFKVHGTNKSPAHQNMTAEFFKLNEEKLEALIQATTHDMEKAEVAILRRANDQYRKIIYNAQVYANTGAGTYEKAVDMATKDFLAAGIQCIQYANGSMHSISDYADMALKTAGKRAYLQGEGEKRQEWGISTVIMNKRGNPCPKCLPFCGKVFIDDVWSDGPKSGRSPVTGIKYPLMSQAIAKGLYHPRCKDVHTTYFEGISTPPKNSPYTREELNDIAERYRQEQKQKYAKRQAEKYDRMAKYSLDEDNKRVYRQRTLEWNEMQYTGVPKTWIKMEQQENDSFRKVNPKYRIHVSMYDEETQKYRENCANCVVAYEMRKRGYKVTAGIPINKLKRNPEKAWKNPEVIYFVGSTQDFIRQVDIFENGTRFQICGIWKRQNNGHTFIAEKSENEIKFLDVQRGVAYNEDILSKMENIHYWKINDLEISDLGVSSCVKE